MTALSPPLVVLLAILGSAWMGWRLPSGMWRRWCSWWLCSVIGVAIAVIAWKLQASLLQAAGVGIIVALFFRLMVGRFSWQPLTERAVGVERILYVIFATGCGVILLYLVTSLAAIGIAMHSADADKTMARDGLSGAHQENVLSEVGLGLGNLATFTQEKVLYPLPIVGDAASELTAVRTILSAPQSDVQAVAHHFQIGHLAQLPVMQAAFADPEYLLLLKRIEKGELVAFLQIANHPHTTRIASDPQFTAVVEGLSARDVVDALLKTQANH